MYKKVRSIFVCIVFLTLILGSTPISELPAHFPRCHRSDPQMEKCLLNATEYVRPYITDGIPDFLPAIKEFIVPQVTIDQQGNRAYNFLVHITKMSIFGMDHYKFNRYIFNSKEPLSSYIDVNLPQLYIKGNYDLKGNLFFASLKGNGSFYVNITDSNCACNYTLEEIKKNGIGYIHSNNISAKMKIGTVTDYGFNGLFADSKDMEVVTGSIIKRNLHILVEEITPAIEKVIAVFLDEVIAKSLEKIPYDKLYPK